MKREDLFQKLLDKFSLTKAEVLEHQEYYNNHFGEYGNEIYADVKTRLVHLLNFWEDDFWFNQRFEPLFENYENYEEIIDFGYGLPYLALYLNDQGKLGSLPKQIFVDKYESAREVSEEILSCLGVKAKFITGDIQSEDVVGQTKDSGSKRLLLALETVEHLDAPEKFWSNLERFSGDDILVSLPVAPKIPSHNLVLDSVDAAREYLSKNIKIEEEHIAQPRELTGRDLDEYKIFSVFGSLK